MIYNRVWMTQCLHQRVRGQDMGAYGALLKTHNAGAILGNLQIAQTKNSISVSSKGGEYGITLMWSTEPLRVEVVAFAGFLRLSQALNVTY